jgi:uncharacterized protein with gpF-like domain
MKLTDGLWQSTEKQLIQLFYEVYFKSIFELFKDEVYNTSNVILDKLRRGQIVLKDGVFTGKFTIQVSKELSKFADFDNRSKSFKIKDISKVPNDILITSFHANEKSKQLHEEINRRIQDMPSNMKDKLDKMDFTIFKSADEIEAELKKEYIKLGVDYKPNDIIKEQLIKKYNENMKLNIVNEDNSGCWNNVQVERLRSMVEKSSLNGYRKDTLIEMIQNEFETSKAKAKFLARQETSIFMSTLRDERYIDSNIKIYQWQGSNDIREVGNPSGLYPKGNIGHGNHWKLNRKYCRFDDNNLYADSLEDVENNIWKSRSNIGCPNTSPGFEYLCRCTARPVITKRY